MPRFPPVFPAQGESAIADAIRARRQKSGRDLTPLDGALLNAPEIASGYNALLTAVRTKNSLPGDVRELMILRVAARNLAAFEWMHHEHVGLDEGLTVPQLALIRDTSRPGPAVNNPKPLSALQAAALHFTDAMTLNVKVPNKIFDALKDQLAQSLPPSGVTLEQRLAEACTTVATYNLVSRFLMAADVGDHADDTVPFPASKTETHSVDVPGCKLHVSTHVSSPSAPWLVFVNSLLTNASMWDGVVARLSPHFNIVTYDQRGHGKSSVPKEACTIDQLADDIQVILETLKIPKPVHAVIGVSQGGATSLGFAVRHPTLASRIVTCDTQIKSPAASRGAWEQRIDLAQSQSMDALAEATVGRWFPPPSIYVEGSRDGLVREMISSTPFEGFVAGAKALWDYDYAPTLADALKTSDRPILLVAGERDGALPAGLSKLADELKAQGVQADFHAVPGSGHLPMVDGTANFLDRLEKFLA